MNRLVVNLALSSLIFLALSDLRVCAIEIDTVPIGSPGNAADPDFDSEHPNGVGAVAYRYRIGKTEITNAQYAEFLNAVADSDPYELYSSSMGSNSYGGIVRNGSDGNYSYAVKAPAQSGSYIYDDKPVVFVSWFDAVRFANWLHNGHGGPETTEDGAYTLLGNTPTPTNELTIARNPDARWWLPSEDEWYKAAYFAPLSESYFNYPTSSNVTPNNNPPSADTGNSTNYRDGPVAQESSYATGNSIYSLTDAGAYALSSSPYGTYDQGGNIWEWNEALFLGQNTGNGWRGLRGGSWFDLVSNQNAGVWSSNIPTSAYYTIGFRVATYIPEPNSLLLAVMAAGLLWWKSRTY
jgi:formylglycine-generating enzyme required for sulfatase activity